MIGNGNWFRITTAASLALFMAGALAHYEIMRWGFENFSPGGQVIHVSRWMIYLSFAFALALLARCVKVKCKRWILASILSVAVLIYCLSLRTIELRIPTAEIEQRWAGVSISRQEIPGFDDVGMCYKVSSLGLELQHLDGEGVFEFRRGAWPVQFTMDSIEKGLIPYLPCK